LFLVLSVVFFLCLVAFLYERVVFFLWSSKLHLVCFLSASGFQNQSVLLQTLARRNDFMVLWSFPPTYSFKENFCVDFEYVQISITTGEEIHFCVIYIFL
uniref:Uncharacterized protein n=1 Tax=Otus sunia TaxID=257818 RepID=A0A8C8EDI0_9STRI